jgi:hypothetical protein
MLKPEPVFPHSKRRHRPQHFFGLSGQAGDIGGNHGDFLATLSERLDHLREVFLDSFRLNMSHFAPDGAIHSIPTNLRDEVGGFLEGKMRKRFREPDDRPLPGPAFLFHFGRFGQAWPKQNMPGRDCRRGSQEGAS